MQVLEVKFNHSSYTVLLSCVHPAARQGTFHEELVFSFCSISIGGQSSGWCSQGCQGIVDTGTSLLTVPTQVFTQLMQYIGAQADGNGQVRPGWAKGGLDKGDASVTSRQLGWTGIGNPVFAVISAEEMMGLIKFASLGSGVAARAGSLSPVSQQTLSRVCTEPPGYKPAVAFSLPSTWRAAATSGACPPSPLSSVAPASPCLPPPTCSRYGISLPDGV